MSDKEIMLKTLDFIKFNNGFTDLKPFWTDDLKLDNERQASIKIKLERNNLATHHIYDAWKLMVTTTGLGINPVDLDEKGNLKRKIIDREYKKGIKTTLLGVVVGFCLTAGLKIAEVKWLKEPPEKTIVLPPIQIVHDTVYVKQDTSLNK